MFVYLFFYLRLERPLFELLLGALLLLDLVCGLALERLLLLLLPRL